MDSQTYWKNRETEQRKHNIRDEAEYQKQIRTIYQNMIDEIEKEINGFYGKYAKKEGITMADARKRAAKADIEALGRKAAKYVKEKNFSEQANDLLREYDLEEERHRRRNGSQYFQEDGYRRVLRNSIIRRKREKQGITTEPVQGQNPYFNQQVNNMNDLFPILDGWNITDDGTLSIRAPEFEAKDNVFKQEALNNMQNVYEENRQRFLASIYNI